MSLMTDTRCAWPGCERLLPVLDEPGMHLCWSHMRLAAEAYLKEIGREVEWFDDNEEVRAWIDSVRAAHPEAWYFWKPQPVG